MCRIFLPYLRTAIKPPHMITQYIIVLLGCLRELKIIFYFNLLYFVFIQLTCPRICSYGPFIDPANKVQNAHIRGSHKLFQVNLKRLIISFKELQHFKNSIVIQKGYTRV